MITLTTAAQANVDETGIDPLKHVVEAEDEEPICGNCGKTMVDGVCRECGRCEKAACDLCSGATE